MHIPFVEREILHTGNPDSAVGPPKIQDPTQPPGWNRGLEAYKEAFGQVGWEKYGQNSYPRPMPENSLAQRLELKAMLGLSFAAFGGKALKTRRRATHTSGVAARGSVTIVSDPQFPEHPFFQASKCFPCRLRHANASFFDDAAAVVRGCALKFADDDFDSPLDLMMNSGPIGAFWNLESFWDFAQARTRTEENEGEWEPQRNWMRRRPMALVGTVSSGRLAPSSFSDMNYYTKIVFPWVGKDGVQRYCKLRIRNPELKTESGLMPYRRQVAAWNQERDKDDGRSPTYLREEFQARVKERGVEYLLQIQLRTADPETDTHEVFNMNQIWDETAHPWLDLAHVKLDQNLTDEEMIKSRWWLGHQPEGMGVLEAYSPLDYRSLGHARAEVYPTAQSARTLGGDLASIPPLENRVLCSE